MNYVAILVAFCVGCGSGAMSTPDDGLPGSGGAMSQNTGGTDDPPSHAQSTGGTGGVGPSVAQGAGGSAGAGGSTAATGGAGGSDPTTGGAGGNEPSADAGAEDGGIKVAPTFVKTRCIDPDQVEPGVEVSFPCDGVDLWVALPEQCTKQRCGLIFNIHGGGMTDHATMDQATNMIALGEQADYVVMHPHKGTWSVASDKEVVFEFLQQAITAFGIDEKRVHSTGYSQGGQISWALGCEHADVLASIAPAEEINRVSDCWQQGKKPAREIPILFAYGKRDGIGGGYDAAKSLAGDVASTWQMTGPETVAGAEGTSYWRQRWTSPTGTEFDFIAHDYTSTGVGGILDGHCLPMNSGTTFVSCSTPVDYDWGKEVVSFFQAHPLP